MLQKTTACHSVCKTSECLQGWKQAEKLLHQHSSPASMWLSMIITAVPMVPMVLVLWKLEAGHFEALVWSSTGNAFNEPAGRCKTHLQAAMHTFTGPWSRLVVTSDEEVSANQKTLCASLPPAACYAVDPIIPHRLFFCGGVC